MINLKHLKWPTNRKPNEWKTEAKFLNIWKNVRNWPEKLFPFVSRRKRPNLTDEMVNRNGFRMKFWIGWVEIGGRQPKLVVWERPKLALKESTQFSRWIRQKLVIWKRPKLVLPSELRTIGRKRVKNCQFQGFKTRLFGDFWKMFSNDFDFCDSLQNFEHFSCSISVWLRFVVGFGLELVPCRFDVGFERRQLKWNIWSILNGNFSISFSRFRFIFGLTSVRRGVRFRIGFMSVWCRVWTSAAEMRHWVNFEWKL